MLVPGALAHLITRCADSFPSRGSQGRRRVESPRPTVQPHGMPWRCGSITPKAFPSRGSQGRRRAEVVAPYGTATRNAVALRLDHAQSLPLEGKVAPEATDEVESQDCAAYTPHQSAVRTAVSLRLGHATALTCHRHVIHSRGDTALPSRGSQGRRRALWRYSFCTEWRRKSVFKYQSFIITRLPRISSLSWQKSVTAWGSSFHSASSITRLRRLSTSSSCFTSTAFCMIMGPSPPSGEAK